MVKKYTVFAPSCIYACLLCGITKIPKGSHSLSATLTYLGEQDIPNTDEKYLLFRNSDDQTNVQLGSRDMGELTYRSLKGGLEEGGVYQFTIRENGLQAPQHVYSLEIERIKVSSPRMNPQAI